MSASEAIAASLDGLAGALLDRGYAVEQVPFLFEPPAEGEWKPGYPTLTYINVLIDHADEGNAVYLPRYGLEALDEGAATRSATAFVPVRGLTVSAMYGARSAAA